MAQFNTEMAEYRKEINQTQQHLKVVTKTEKETKRVQRLAQFETETIEMAQI